MPCSKKYKECSIYFLLVRKLQHLVSGEVVENVAVKLLQLAVTELPSDVKESLQNAYNTEDSPVGKSQLKAILDNIELAQKTGAPMCQDTGIIIFYVKAGRK